MPIRCEQIHETYLSPASTREQYTLHLAALEWSLAEPIIIQSPEDIKSRKNWQDFDPYEHQVQNLFTFAGVCPLC